MNLAWVGRSRGLAPSTPRSCATAAPALSHRQTAVAKLMLPGMAFEFKAVRRVEFSETDMAGIVHFANFFRYMETAEHGFFRELGYSVVMDQFDPPLGWPRVHADCDYRQPLRFEDEVEIHLLVSEKKSKSLSYIFKFNKLTGTGPSRQREEVARGSLTVVCVAKQSDGKMAAVHIPKLFADKIEVAPAEML
jgi:acyl-CoA thioester hydrolase